MFKKKKILIAIESWVLHCINIAIDIEKKETFIHAPTATPRNHTHDATNNAKDLCISLRIDECTKHMRGFVY